MLSENELNNVIGEFYFNHYNNSGTEDITYNQLKDNRASGIGFNQLANNGNNGDADGFDELVNNNDNSDIKAIDFNQSYSNHGNLFDEASQSLSQEFNKSFLKIIEGEKVDLENSIKGDLKRIEQIRMEVINKQNKINELKGLIDRVKQNKIDKPNGKVRVVRQNKSAAQNGKVLPSFSNQTVSKRPTIERKILLMEDYMKRTSTIKELCERYKISKQTFYRIKEDYESFKGGLNVEKVEIKEEHYIMKLQPNQKEQQQSGD
ncbi:hypothetical protein K502DRAFT_354083 [Neoconidiobolus thromboides FSU 785]|nr:hypothetical protein K502DRAFT_354083 [Neoconidiobolus thromboides FSU 785]